MTFPRHLLPVAFFPVALVAAVEPVFLDYPAALEQAKATGSDILLFQDGSDWASESAALNAALASPVARARLGRRVIWARLDNPDLGEPGKDSKVPVPDVTPWNLPALQLIAPDGRTQVVAEGLTAAKVPGVLAAIPGALDARVRRDALRAKAESASGVEKARLLGAFLDSLPLSLAQGRKDIREAIRKADPKDESGYTFKYDFDAVGASSFHEHKIGKLLREKKYDEALAEANERLKGRALSTNQRQIIMAARFQVYRAQEDMAKVDSELKAMVAVDPKSDMGRGAAAYLRDHTLPVKLNGLAWRPDQNTPVWLPFVADVSKLVTAPGTYEIEFKHRSGHTRFRKVSLLSGRKEVAAEANPKEQRKVRLRVASLPRGPLELWAEARGTGWFDGAGDIVVTKVD